MWIESRMFCYLFSLSPLNTRHATVVCILWQLLVCSKKNGLCFLVTVWVRNLCILHRSQSFFCRWCSQRQSKHQKSLLNPRCCGAKAHIRPATLAAAAVAATPVPAMACHHCFLQLSSSSSSFDSSLLHLVITF